MVAVITGDIINSRKEEPIIWLPLLKEVLKQYGKSAAKWEIFRGDSFQLATAPQDAVKAAIHIKAAIRAVKNLDVRMGIGVGEQDHEASRISESNGAAFVRSGEAFESLKKQTIGIKTGQEEIDEFLNLLLSFALLTMDTWSPTVSEAIKTSLENPGKSQTEIAQQLGKSQSSLSEALKRGGYEEVLRLLDFYQKKMNQL